MNISKCVVITGSIGCGKTSVCNILKERGYAIIDADTISRSVAEDSADEIKSAFGEEYIKNGRLDRQKLGALIFQNKNAKEKLEAIMHPKIKNAIFEKVWELEKEKNIYFVDIPLFYENQNYSELSPIAVVYAPVQTQLERLIARNGISESDAKNMIAAQIDIEIKKEKADFIIDNSGHKDKLDDKVNNFLEEVDRWFYKNTARAETIF